MQNRLGFAFAAMGLWCLFAAPAFAQVGDMEHCRDDDSLPAENIVAACTRFIGLSFQQNWNLQFVPAAFVIQAHAYERLGKYDKAEQSLKADISRYPGYAPGWVEFGELLEKLQGPGILMGTLDLMIKSNPGNPDILNSACWTRTTKGEQLDAALANCNESLRIKPADANTLDTRAFTYFRMGKFPEAIADANAALAANPKIASSLFIRGLAKQKTGNAADASADIASAKLIDPKIADTYAGYGVTP